MSDDTQPQRIGPGLLDNSQRISFVFNDKKYHGYAGDTLASALLANGQRLLGRSFKYHRREGWYLLVPKNRMH